MSILEILTKEEFAARWTILPDKLKGVLASTDVKAKIDSIGASFGVPAEKLPELEAVVTTVFMGILDIDLVWDETRELFGLDAKQAYAIDARLYKEVFEPYMQDIEGVYAPLVPYGEDVSPVPKSDGQELNAKASPAPFFMPSSAPGSAAGPTLNLRGVPPTPSPAPLTMKPSTGAIPGTPSPSKTSETGMAPMPFILQKSVVSEPVIKDSGFRLNLDPKLFGGGPSRPVVPMPPKAAKLELGTVPSSGTRYQAPDTHAAPVAPRVVHYSAPQNPMGIKAAPAPAVGPKGENKGLNSVPKPPMPGGQAPGISPAPASLKPNAADLKPAPSLDLRPHPPAVKPVASSSAHTNPGGSPPAGLPVTNEHPVGIELNLKKENTIGA